MPRKDDIQGLLRDRFQNFEAEPEVDLWKGIEADLYPEKQRSRKLWPYFSIAASIAILIFTWVYLGQSEMSQEQVPNFVEERTPAEKQEIETPPFTNPNESLEQETQMAVESEESSSEAEKRREFKPQQKVEAPVAERKSPTQQVTQPLFNKKDLLNRPIAQEELDIEKLEKIEKKDSQLAVPPIQKELFAERKVKVEQPQPEIEQPQTEQPQVENVSPTTSPDEPVIETKGKTKSTLDLNNISFKNIVSLASDGIDKIKDASPVKVYEEKNDKGESKVYQLNLFNLSVSHKTQKRRNKKVRL